MTPKRAFAIEVADRRGIAAVEPDAVGQVRRAELAAAGAVLAVAGGAVVDEELARRLRRPPGPRAWPESDSTYCRESVDLLRLQDVAEGRHLAEAGVGVGLVADAVGDGLPGCRRRCRPRASRRRAGSGSARPPRRRRRRGTASSSCGRPRRRRRWRSAGARGRSRRRRGPPASSRASSAALAARAAAISAATSAAARIAEEPRGGAGDQRPGREQDRVDHPPDDGGVERPQPPARHRRVELLDAVPLVAGGLGLGRLVDLALARRRARPLSALSSLRKIWRAASSCASPAPGRNTQTTTATEATRRPRRSQSPMA